jgi:hypothetical protein
MGETISNNILLPIMYLLVNCVLTVGLMVLVLILIEKIINSKFGKSIMERIG